MLLPIYKRIKELIIKPNLIHFFNFIDKLESDCSVLKTANLSDDNKNSINGKIGDDFIEVRKKFIDILRAADPKLYNRVQFHFDLLQDNITKAIFDGGIVLSNDAKYKELISDTIDYSKTDIINLIFKFDGKIS